MEEILNENLNLSENNNMILGGSNSWTAIDSGNGYSYTTSATTTKHRVFTNVISDYATGTPGTVTVGPSTSGTRYTSYQADENQAIYLFSTVSNASLYTFVSYAAPKARNMYINNPFKSSGESDPMIYVGDENVAVYGFFGRNDCTWMTTADHESGCGSFFVKDEPENIVEYTEIHCPLGYKMHLKLYSDTETNYDGIMLSTIEIPQSDLCYNIVEDFDQNGYTDNYGVDAICTGRNAESNEIVIEDPGYYYVYFISDQSAGSGKNAVMYSYWIEPNESPTYTVTGGSKTGGTVYVGTSSNPTTTSVSADSGTKIYVKCVPSSGYTFSSWSATGTSSTSGTTSATGGYLNIQSSNVTVNATFLAETYIDEWTGVTINDFSYPYPIDQSINVFLPQGQTKIANLDVVRTGTRRWSSGRTESISSAPQPGEIWLYTYFLESGDTGFSIDDGDGTVTASNNTRELTRWDKAYVYVKSPDGIETTQNVQISQSAGTKVYSEISGGYVSYAKFNLGSSQSSIPTNTVSPTQTYTWNGVGETHSVDSSDIIWVYSMTSGNGFSLDSSSTGRVSVTNNTTTSERTSNTITLTFNGLGGKTRSITTTATQVAGRKYYSSLSGGSITYSGTIPASGGSITPTITKPTQSWTWNNEGSATSVSSSEITYGNFSPYSTTLTEGFTLESSTGKVTANNNKSTWSRYSGSIQLIFSSPYKSGYQTGTGSTITVIGSANQDNGYYSYSDITGSLSYPTQSAAAGSVTPTLTYNQTYGWNGNTTELGNVTSGLSKGSYSMTNGNGATLSSTSTGKITWAANKITDSTGGVQRTSNQISVTVSGNGSKTKTLTTNAIQSADTISSYGEIGGTLSLSIDGDIPASGGSKTTSNCTATKSCTQTNTYVSGATKSGTVTYGSITGSTVSAGTLGTTEKTRTLIKSNAFSITATGEGSKTKTAYVSVYQQANSATYGDLGGTLTLSIDGEILASGGSKSTSNCTATKSCTQTVTYTDGSTRAGTVTYGSITGSTVSAGTRGTTVDSAATLVKSNAFSITATGEGSKTKTAYVSVYQQRNVITNSDYNSSNIDYTVTKGTISNSLTAAGGYASWTAGSAGHTHKYYYLYTDSSTSGPYTSTVSDSVSSSATGTNSRFTINNTNRTVTHSNMTTNEATDTLTVTWKNANNTSITDSSSISVTNGVKSLAVSLSPTSIKKNVLSTDNYTSTASATATLDSNSTKSVTATYTSSNTGVATISGSTARSVGTGTTTITGSYGGKTGTATLTVTDRYSLYAKDSGSWKPIKSVYKKINGSWVLQNNDDWGSILGTIDNVAKLFKKT